MFKSLKATREPNACPEWSRSHVVVYLLSLLLIGLGYVGLTPIFEGFDETAHFSNLRQVAATGKIPVYGSSHFDQEVVDYKGPVPYGSADPPFNRDFVSSKFFSDPESVRDFVQRYRKTSLSNNFEESERLNWEAQHPPLYYLLLAPLTKATDELPLVTQILWLRIASYALALAGVAVSLIGTMRMACARDRNSALLGYLLYPVIFPMFFPEFARIGNDALCLFLSGVVALLVKSWSRLNRIRSSPH